MHDSSKGIWIARASSVFRRPVYDVPTDTFDQPPDDGPRVWATTGEPSPERFLVESHGDAGSRDDTARGSPGGSAGIGGGGLTVAGVEHVLA
jgi:hypothetical protein